MRTLPRVPSAKAANASGARSSGMAVLDVDADLTLGGMVEQGGELVGGRRGHDRGDGDVLASDLLGTGPAGRRQRAAGLQGGAECGGFAGGVQDLVDPLRCDRPDRGGGVAGVVDGVRCAEAADVLLLLTRLRGADDGGAGGRRELHRDRADSPGPPGDEHRGFTVHLTPEGVAFTADAEASPADVALPAEVYERYGPRRTTPAPMAKTKAQLKPLRGPSGFARREP